ncbi:MAG: MBOAT family protein [Anaerofustis sp.]
MLFSSMSFIWIFLPLVLASNLIFQKLGGNKASNILLLIASIFFYAWGEPVYVLLMVISIFVNWMAGIIVSKVNKHKGIVLFAAVIINLALIGYFKYSGMLIISLNAIFGTSFSIPDIALPIGISFFTFQELSYVIDVYRKECEPQKNILKVALYVSFFPQLIAGPIVKYKDIEKQIDGRTISTQQITEGGRRFAYGFAKKILIANILAYVVDSIYSLEISNVTWSMAWLASLMYTFQIYYDFSGYSDMAIGLGKMFGFEFKENFNYPYTSFSIREFWRRWHISLSSWFRDYVYIPLGGSRGEK